MFKAFKKLLKSMSLLGVLARTGMANNSNCFENKATITDLFQVYCL